LSEIKRATDETKRGKMLLDLSEEVRPAKVACLVPSLRAFWLRPFQDHLTLEVGSSPRTSEAYGRDLTRFATYAVSKGARAPQEVGATTLRST